MRKAMPAVLFIIVILLAKAEVFSQTTLAKEMPCQPEAEEVLSIIKSVYKISPISEGVLITGEITTAGGMYKLPKEPITLLQYIAIRGGVLKTAKQPLYLIRQSSDEKTKIKLEIDISKIKQGLAKDVRLEKGDVIFVSRGCANGELLPPTKSPETLMTPPIPKLDERVT